MAQFVTLLLFIPLGWLLLVRPQRQRIARHLALVESLVVGDEVITSGGLLGVITALDDDTLGLEIADGVVVRIAKAAIHDRKAPSAPEDNT